jgi:hypothetical protein
MSPNAAIGVSGLSLGVAITDYGASLLNALYRLTHTDVASSNYGASLLNALY